MSWHLDGGVLGSSSPLPSFKGCPVLSCAAFLASRNEHIWNFTPQFHPANYPLRSTDVESELFAFPKMIAQKHPPFIFWKSCAPPPTPSSRLPLAFCSWEKRTQLEVLDLEGTGLPAGCLWPRHCPRPAKHWWVLGYRTHPRWKTSQTAGKWAATRRW